MKLTEMAKATKWLRLVQCGTSGAGKTCAASTFPKPLYYADCEDGLKSLLSFYDYDEKKLEGIEYDQYMDKNPSVPDAYRKLNDKVMGFSKMSKFPYATIVIDSLTTFEDRVMNFTMASVQARRVLDAPTQQDYGLTINKIEEFVQMLITLPCHIILNCHIQTIQNELTKEIVTQPLVVGKKLPSKLPIWFDECYALTNKNGERKWQIRPSGFLQMPKTRILPKSTPDFIPATWDELNKYLKQ